MTKQKTLDLLIGVALAWGLFLNISVVLAFEFVLSMAAGGNFVQLPNEIRVVYFFQALFIVYQAVIYFRSASGKKVQPKWIFLVLAILDGIGALLNLFSTSPNERWNAVALLLMTYGFWVQHKKQKTL